MESLKKHSWSLYLIILICFAMPFVTVGCEDSEEKVATGIQLAGDTKGLGLQPLITGAMLAVASGLICTALIRKPKMRFISGAIANMTAVVLLVIFKMECSKTVIEYNVIRVDFNYGYWVVLVLNILVFLLMLYLIIYKHDERNTVKELVLE